MKLRPWRDLRRVFRYQLLVITLVVLGPIGCLHRGKIPGERSMLFVPIETPASVFGQPEATSSDSPFRGGLSDLYFSPSESRASTFVFYTLTDRGPNGREPEGLNREFMRPDYQPRILKLAFERGSHQVKVIKVLTISKPNGEKSSGRPNVDGRRFSARFDETPRTSSGQHLPFDPWGIDPEGLVAAPDGGFWIAEEYGPSLLKLDSTGQILRRFLPREPDPGLATARAGIRSLPAFVGERQLNRGFEALSWTSQGNLLAFMQSEIPSQHRKWAPVLEFDPRTEKAVGLFFYPLHSAGGKIGGAALGPDGQVYVLEQNGERGSRAWQAVFRLDWTKATNAMDDALRAGPQWAIPTGANPLGLHLALQIEDPRVHDLEKLEGLSFLPEGVPVLLNDNDFGVDEGTEHRQSYLLFGDKKIMNLP